MSTYLVVFFLFLFLNRRFCTFGALAGVLVGSVRAFGAIFTRRAGTLVDVCLAETPGKAWQRDRRLLLSVCVSVFTQLRSQHFQPVALLRTLKPLKLTSPKGEGETVH